MWGLTLPLVLQVARAGSMYFAGGSLLGWAGSNMLQTSQISSDNAKKLELQWLEYQQQNRYLDLREEELIQKQDEFLDQIAYDNLEFSREQALQIISFNQNSQLQGDRLQFEADTQMQEQTQTLQERNMYIEEKAVKDTFTMLAGMGISTKITQHEINKLSYAISELEKHYNLTNTPDSLDETTISKLNANFDITSSEEFDYAKGSEIPEEFL